LSPTQNTNKLQKYLSEVILKTDISIIINVFSKADYGLSGETIRAKEQRKDMDLQSELSTDSMTILQFEKPRM